jgi:hypothetical protein
MVSADDVEVEGVGGGLGDGERASLVDGFEAWAGRCLVSFFIVALLVAALLVVVGIVDHGGLDRRRSWFLRRWLAVVVGAISEAGFNAFFHVGFLARFSAVRSSHSISSG